MKANQFFFSLTLLILASCSNYQKLLKGSDSEAKFAAAKEYFAEKKFEKSATLFDDLSSAFRGTKRMQEVLYLLAESYFGQKDYLSAVEHFSVYMRNYPQGEFIENCAFQKANSYYKLSPDVRLEQTHTISAIAAFEDYITMFPNSEKTPLAHQMLAEMNDKLAQKAFLNAKMYFNLGIYLGNNYRSAILVAENALRRFPETKFRDDLTFIILNSKFKEAIHSVNEKKNERYSEVVDEYYNYVNEFPEGKNIKEANKILNQANNFLKK